MWLLKKLRGIGVTVAAPTGLFQCTNSRTEHSPPAGCGKSLHGHPFTPFRAGSERGEGPPYLPDFETAGVLRFAQDDGLTAFFRSLPVWLMLAVALAWPPAARARGGKVTLARKFRPGQTMVYTTQVRARAKVNSNPPGIKDFFPPVPADLTLRQQNTVKVVAVHADGAADIEHRFDRFEVHADLAGFPDSLRDSTQQAQREFTERLTGQKLIVHYDRGGGLVGFEGEDQLLAEIDAPLREPLRQMLRLFLEQMGGQALYPNHPVKPGDEWKQSLNAEPRPDYPFLVRGESTLHFSGKTQFHGVKAGIVDLEFQNALTPTSTSLRHDGALPELESMGMRLDIDIRGQGKGRVLVALDDGRVLQNHSSLHQTLNARMQGREGNVGEPAKLEIQSDTEMDVEGKGP